jgi:hypothetical protein
MTSQGSAYARFERSLDTGDPGLIVPAALELPRVSLADGVRIVLAIAQSGRDGGASWRMTYDGVAVRFGAAVARRLELRVDEAVLMFAARQRSSYCSKPISRRRRRRSWGSG